MILGSAAFLIEPIEVRAERLGLRPIADRVEAAIASEGSHGLRVDVAQRAEMQLFRPAFLRVEPAEEDHHERGKGARLFGRVDLPGASSVEGGRGIRVGAWIRVADGKAVIGEPSAGIMEGLVPGAQRIEEIREFDDGGVRHGRELLDPRVEDVRNVHVQRAIRPERRVDPRLEA